MAVREAARSAAVGLGAALLVGLLAWPAPVDPSGHAVGGAGGDFATIAWGLWWVARHFPAAPPVEIPAIMAPDGVRLLIADLPEAMALAPLTRLAGPVVAFNLLQVLHVALSAALCFALVRAVAPAGRRPGVAAATAGAAAFALSPVLLSGVHNGNADVTPVYLLPLAGLLVRWAPTGWLAAAAAGVGIGLAPWCNPYVGVMVAVVAVLLCPWPRSAGQALRIGLAAAVAGALALVFVRASLESMAGPGSMVFKTPVNKALSDGAATVAGMLWGQVQEQRDGWSVHAWYLGLVTLALAAVGAWTGRAARAWLLRLGGLVAVGVLLALGRALHLDEQPLQLGDGPLWLPWAWLGNLPGLEALRIPYRFASLAALGLAGFGAVGAQALARKPALGWLLAAGVAADLLVLGRGAGMLAAGEAPRDAACALLAELPPGAVLDLPATYDERWLLAQTCHGRAVAAGVNQPYAAPVRGALKRAPQSAAVELDRIGFAYVLLHEQVEAEGGQAGMFEAWRKAAADGMVRVAAEREGVIAVELAAP